MGKELRRVPLDFSWPLDETWGGYINPYSKALRDCDACRGRGVNPPTRLLECLWYRHQHFEAWTVLQAADDSFPASLLAFARTILASERGWSDQLDQSDVDALVEGDRLWDWTRRPRTEEQREEVRRKMADGGNSWLPRDNGYRPTAEEINEANRKNFIHDAINSYICLKARARFYGVYGNCPVCNGKAYRCDKETERRYKRWRKSDPPTGPGYQVWETVSEGSPISPVFDRPAALIGWLVAQGYSQVAAERFAEQGWAMSAMSVRHGGGTVEFARDIESLALFP